MPDGIGIKGLQEALYDNQKRIAALRPSSHFGRIIRDATIHLQRYAIGITHVWVYKGGALRASHRTEMRELQGRIYIDPSAVNPRGQRPRIYGPFEERRGGSHAFYARTIAEAGPGETREAQVALGRILVR